MHPFSTLRFYDVLRGVEKGYIGNEWVKGGILKFQTEKQHPNRTSFENEFSWISNNFLICYAWIKLSLLGFFDIGERNKTLSNVTEIVLVCGVILHV